MREYLPLANELRPKKWEEVIYNEPVTLILRNMLKNNKIANAILLSGVRGIGKTSIARLFSKSLNCEKLDNNQNPCGKCQSCMEAKTSGHPDIIEVSGSTNGKIEDIRNILESASYTPLIGKYKVFIIDEAQGLGVSQSSWDALLKVLEEPPPDVMWIFCTTQKSKIPQTIKSRMVALDLRMVPTQVLSDYITKIFKMKGLGLTKAPSTDVAPVVANLANNSVRDALTLLEKVIPYCNEKGWSRGTVLEAVGAFDAVKVADILNMVVQHNAAGLWVVFNQILESGVDAETLFDSVASIINNVMTIFLGGVVEQSDLYLPFMGQFTSPRIIYLCDVVLRRARELHTVVNRKMVIQMLALELCG